jgi:hypothetical protein
MSEDRKDSIDNNTNDVLPGAISRRSLLKAGGAATLAGTLIAGGIASADTGSEEDDPFKSIQALNSTRETYWDPTGKFFTQQNVKMDKVDQGIIGARIDGEWHDFIIRELDDAFFDSNIAMRNRMFEVMTGAKQYTIYNDAHNAAVGTYGGNRGDSRFHVNVAFKGMGWVPRKDKLASRIAELETNYTASMMTKVQVLFGGYQDATLWDRRLQGSLELYTTREYETHTFLNQMVNPVSTICFIGEDEEGHILSYEFRTVTRLMHYNDPNLTDYEKNLVKYINFAHDFFHGGPDPSKLIVHNIGVAYFIVEEFDNSPWGATATAGGKKVVPAG